MAHEWGLAAITIPEAGSGWNPLNGDAPGWDAALAIERFLPFGGRPGNVTPTAVHLLSDADGLCVRFTCVECNSLYRPVGNSRYNSGLGRPQFADAVFVVVRPDCRAGAYEVFAVASSGDVGTAASGGEKGAVPEGPGRSGFSSAVVRRAGSWTATFHLSWERLGGRLVGPFGLQFVRVRGQSGERLSPTALAFGDVVGSDLCLEARLGEAAAAIGIEGDLARLPSGAQRWQRRASLTWPTVEECRQIADLQRERSLLPTTAENLAARLRLAARWLDLLTLEGFSFHPQGGCWEKSEGEYQPEEARATVNEALRRGATAEACHVVERFLGQLERHSRRWFADGTPGCVDDDAWQAVERLGTPRLDGREVVIEAWAGGQALRLCLSFPFATCLRIHADPPGHFRPAGSEGICVKPGRSCTRLVGPRLTVEVVEGDRWVIAATVPGGRRRWQLRRGDVFVRLDDAGGITAVDVRLPLGAAEVVCGFGERFDALDVRGRVATLYDLDAWEGLIYGLQNHIYKPIQLFHSSAGYSAFINSTCRLRVDGGRRWPDRLRLTQHGAILDWFVWLDAPLAALDDYTALTGRPVRPPRWAFEPWFGGGWERWKKGPCQDPASEIRAVAQRFRQLDIPHSAVYAEGVAMDDPRTCAWLNPQGIRVLAWMNSDIPLDQQRRLLGGVADGELPVLRRAGGEASTYVDFTHPRAADLCDAFWRHRLDIGVAGSMVDFGDRVPEDAVCHDGRRGDLMHNLYALDYHRHFHAAFARRRGADFVLFSRSAAPGSQQWLCQFSGDHQPNFVGMHAALRGMLNLCASGFPTVGGDIGGYFGWPDPEVYIRWVQLGCFSGLMRCHGTAPREPWEYGDETVSIYRFHAWLRENLLDTIAAAAARASTTGEPLMAPLGVAFPDDPAVAPCDDAFLFAGCLLVAPMLAPGVRRAVRFPAGGAWFDLWDGRRFDGGTAAEVDAPLAKVPVFVRAGAVLPVRLAPSLAWGESAATVPCGAGTVALTPVAEGFEFTLDGVPDTRYLILYGVSPEALEEVRVQGRALDRLTASQWPARPVGWVAADGRIVVRLPEGRRRHAAIIFGHAQPRSL
ncbi:MAG: Alpha-xylosidase [Lentisphaerae bacterium ADurb.BinA184]|nr:MAG: Alpha-xylosidase [Lentisphaerae bacterium ADurb.BinA184]